MLFTNTTFLGVDPTAGQKPFVYAALDLDLGLIALGQGDMEYALAFLAGQRQVLVAISAPRRPNLGLLGREEIRQSLAQLPRPGRWVNFRMAEYLIRQHNIHVPQTLAQESDCPRWMQVGFHFYRRLEELGYVAYPSDEAQRQYLEVYPHACFTAMLGLTPFPKHTLEGRLQRQLALNECKLKVSDPMRFFEEITRHRLLKGILPLENLYTPSELDALVAAYTAWMAFVHPDQVTVLGYPEEGQIVLPVAALKTHY
jgi:hypothetical protein